MYLNRIRFALRFREFKNIEFVFIESAPDVEFYRIEAQPGATNTSAKQRVILPRALISSSGKQGRLKEFLRAWSPLINQLVLDRQLTGYWEFSGSDAGHPNLLSMEGPSCALVIPDLYAIRESQQKRYPQWEDFSTFERHFQERSETVFWRGSTTGSFSGDSLQDKLRSNSRISICLLFRDFRPSFDIQISRVSKISGVKSPQVARLLRQWDILAPPVKEDLFDQFKYFPSLPGNAQPWGTLRKMAQGSLVFAPNLPSKLLYQFDLIPGHHYIEVRADFKDLSEAVRCAQANPQRSARIAFEGSMAARQYLATMSQTIFKILYKCNGDRLFCNARQIP